MLITLCVSGIFSLYKSELTKKFYTIFSYGVVFLCELMTVFFFVFFVIVAERALLLVLC